MKQLLTDSQIKELKEHLENHTYHRAKDIVVYIKEKYSISYTENCIQ